MIKNQKEASVISIIIPAYNEEDNIIPLYQKLIEVLDHFVFEIIFIDDGSRDKTIKRIIELAQKDSRVKYISFSRNFGHQSALKAGLDFAQGDCVISLDADLQHPPEIISQMLKKWREGYEIVYTVRDDLKNTGIFKRISSNIFYTLFQKLSGYDIEQGAADFRLMDRKVVNVIRNSNESVLFLRGLISWIGFNQCALKYIPAKRLYGKSKYTIKRMFIFALNGITSFSVIPLHLATLIGFLLSIISGIYGIYALVIHFLTNETIIGWTSVIMCILFIGGIQLVMLGILGEYLGRLFLETKKRPLYVIKSMKVE